MAELDLGKVTGEQGPQGIPGSQWYQGTAVTGEATSGTVFPDSGVLNAVVNDKYWNTDTNNVYTCVLGGDSSTAQWAYVGNIQGPQGNIGPIGPTGNSGTAATIQVGEVTSGDVASVENTGTSTAAVFDFVLPKGDPGPQGPKGEKGDTGEPANITGAASSIIENNLSANRALISDGSGKVAASGVTSTELGYLDGVTSGIQGQLNGKQGTVTGGASTITGSNLTANRALVSNGSGKVAVSAVTSTELGYLDGVTSGIQGQINGLSNNLKAPQYGEVSGNVAEVSAGSMTTKTICTCQKTGTVFIWARCAYPSDYGNSRQMVTVNKNGKEIAREDGILYISGISIRREVSTFVKCVPGDTITVSALNQAGSGKRLTFDWRYAVIGT